MDEPLGAHRRLVLAASVRDGVSDSIGRKPEIRSDLKTGAQRRPHIVRKSFSVRPPAGFLTNGPARNPAAADRANDEG